VGEARLGEMTGGGNFMRRSCWGLSIQHVPEDCGCSGAGMPRMSPVLLKYTFISVISFLCPGQYKHSDSIICNKQKHLGKQPWQKKKPSYLAISIPWLH